MNSTLDEFELEILPPAEESGSRTPIGSKMALEPALTSARPSTSTPSKHIQAQQSAFRTEEEDRLISVPNAKPKKEEIVDDYNVTLNLTDISYGVKGHNKFYEIKILKKFNTYILFTKWARVGAKNPQSKLEEFGSKIEAVKAFKKKFYQKTLNEWDERENFQVQEGKYTMINVDGTGISDAESMNKEVQRLNQRNQELKRRIENNPSNLEKGIHILMKMIWDINRMSRTLKELNIDTTTNPLGKLKTDQIQKGYKILNEIQNVLMSDVKKTKLIELSNQFYTNIPQSFGMRKPPAIDNTTILKEKIKLLDTLKELEIANKYINLSLFQRGKETANPLDCFYELLNINIQRVHESEKVFELMQTVLKDGHGPTHDRYKLELLDLYEVERKGEKERFWPFKHLHNRGKKYIHIITKALLWHGSRSTNFVGILSEGLRIAPPEAPVTGYMFGKGIYFADVHSKSANYCHASPENPEGLLILAEVALGDVHKVNKAKAFKKPPIYHHSVCGVGKMRPNPQKRVYLGDSVMFETGEIIENQELFNEELGSRIQNALQYNEFIVYDVGQVKIKYILRVKFNFTSGL